MDTKGIYEPLRRRLSSRQYYMTTVKPTSFSMTDLRVLAKVKALGLGRLSDFDWAVLDKVYSGGVERLLVMLRGSWRQVPVVLIELCTWLTRGPETEKISPSLS